MKTKREKEIMVIHHWMGLLSAKMKERNDYSMADLREIKNLSMNIYMDVDKYLFEHREKGRRSVLVN